MLWIFLVPGPFQWAAIVAGLVAHAFLFVPNRFLCPRCDGRMLGTWWVRMEHSERCRHCGIAVGTPERETRK
jgi:hypothetical protein